MNSEALRRKLMAEGLIKSELLSDPIKQFELWYAQTLETELAEPNAVALATVDAQGQPWQRMVLLKLFDEQGFVFFTNYASRKAAHIAGNPHVSLLFPWQALGRQVKVTGTGARIPASESMRYFATRPRGSQIGAWVSAQSSVIASRSLLESKFQEIKKKFKNKDITLPSFWGGYRVVPDQIEFWQGRANRLHDRFQYTKQDDGSWTIERLAP